MRGLEIQAVVLYNQYVPENSIDLHIAAVPGKRWMTPSFLRATFRYPFLQLGVRQMGALVASDNADSLRLTRRVGFIQEGVARQAWADGIDVICFGMLRHECKWLDGPAPDIWSLDLDGQARVRRKRKTRKRRLQSRRRPISNPLPKLLNSIA